MKKNVTHYKTLFLLNPNPCCVYHLNGLKISDANTAAQALFTKSIDELLSMSLYELFANEDTSSIKKVHYSGIDSEGRFEFSGSINEAVSGKQVKLNVTGQRINIDNSECVIAVFEEIDTSKNGGLDVNKILDSSLDVFCVFNKKGDFVYVSGACHEHWGYTQDELIGTRFQNLVLKEDVEKTNKIFENILNGENAKSFYNRYSKKNGDIAYNLWSSRWEESTSLIYAVAKDYKESFEIKQETLRNETHFRSLVQGAFDLIGVVDVNGYYTYMSPACVRITGFPPETFVGTNAFEFVHPDDVDQVRADFQESISKGSINMQLYRAKNDKNEWRWVETTLRNLLDEPVVDGIVVNSRDVTERVKEREHLKLLESVITHTTDAVLITEAEPLSEPGPRIIYVNEAFTQMTGYTAEEVIGKTPRILQGPNSNKEELGKLSKAMKNWESYETTTINYKKNGEEFWINFTVTPIANEKGWYTHWVAIENDVTELKIEELGNELLAQISQDFNVENRFSVSAKELCKTIRDFADFDWVELWTSDIEHTQMSLYSYALRCPKDELFYDYDTDFNILEIANGLAGNVWSEGHLLLWGYDQMSENFVRFGSAKKIGLNAIMGIPLIFNGEIIGVLKVGSKHGKIHLEKHSALFMRLQNFIGSELNRKKLENDLSHLFNAIPDIICLLDFEERILKINKAGCELLGYKEEEILYLNIEAFVHPEDKGRFLKEIKTLGSDKKTFNLEIRCFNKNGKVIWLSWYCNPAQSEDLIYATAKDITEEKKLRELNRQVNELVEMGSWELDTSSNNLYWSDELHKLYDTDPKLFHPTVNNTLNFWREDFQQTVLKSFENTIDKGQPLDFEAVIITSNKKEVWVRVNGRAETIDGQVVRVFGSTQNISNIKDSEHRLLAFAENLPGLIYQYSIHPDGTDSIDFILGNVKEIWGLNAEEVKQDNSIAWAQVEAGGDLEKVKASIANAIETKSKWSCRMRYVNPSGELKTHLGFGTPYFQADGTVVFNSIILDITKEAMNEELLTHTTKMASIGSWEVHLIDQTVYWSDEVHRLHETDPDSYIPDLESGIEFYREDFREMVSSKVEKAIEEGSNWDFEAVIVTKTNKERWIRSIGSADFVNGKCVRLFGGFQDINNKKLMELELNKLNKDLQKHMLELERSNEELEQFAFIASHDLQEPLRMISGFMDQLERKYGDQLDEKAHKYIHFATDGAKRMKQIILDLLEYSRASRLKDEKEAVDINLLIDEYVKLRRKLISEKSASIEYTNLPVLNSYKAALTQIVHCLIDNALKYSKEGTPVKIEVRAKEHEKEWEFSVKDNGIGIDSQFFDKIFIIFQRLHNHKNYEGTGIGLSVAKRHIEVLGGQIWLESSLGKGSTFYFTIPKH